MESRLKPLRVGRGCGSLNPSVTEMKAEKIPVGLPRLMSKLLTCETGSQML